jgi:formylglycine-generating enzyme required for sulfatase activity
VATGQVPDRVFRGGSWFSDARHVRAALRGVYARANRRVNLGFRLASRQEIP